MKTLVKSLALATGLLLCVACQKVKTPEQSKLFEPFVDPESGVVSYVLQYGAPTDNRQSIYFTSKSMTNDGRFLVFWHTEGNEQLPGGAGPKHQMLADLKTDRVYDMGPSVMTPYVEVNQNYMVYGDRRRGFFRRNFDDPLNEIKLCDIPEALTSLGRVLRLATHLTLTSDRRRAFLDTEILTPEGKSRYIQGMLDLETGAWDQWNETEWCCNHGQVNPVDDNLAMVAWEFCWKDEGKAFQERTGIYPRMWLIRKDSMQLIPAQTINFASHEIWDDDGKGISWCSHGYLVDEHCVYHRDLATGEEQVWAPIPGARHNSCSPDNKYVVTDQAPEKWWRGCKWRVAFYNRETGKYVWLYSTREALMPLENQSKLHPDPHPHFVANGKYVVSTASNADGHMDVFVTPVAQMIEMTK